MIFSKPYRSLDWRPISFETLQVEILVTRQGGAVGAIDFPEMFRAPLCCYGTECCTVSRHENRNFTGGLRKMNQGTVDFRLQARELGEVL
jgi:hypothetical protein